MIKKIFIVVLCILMFVFLLRQLGFTSAQANGQQVEFDHSQCKYPTRPSNPPDGCDENPICDQDDFDRGGAGYCYPKLELNHKKPNPNRQQPPASSEDYVVEYEGSGK